MQLAIVVRKERIAGGGAEQGDVVEAMRAGAGIDGRGVSATGEREM